MAEEAIGFLVDIENIEEKMVAIHDAPSVCTALDVL